jgi:flavin reductase (DIM6/NTAB) family NADH-FMN oxidoreductase RutF
MDVDSASFRKVMGHYPTGVCVITSIAPGGAAVGLTVGTFTSVSLNPPLIGFFPDKKSTSWPLIGAAGQFCVNILASDQEAVCRTFSVPAPDRFAEISHSHSQAGLPVLDGAAGWLDCDIYSVVEAGDHYFVLGRVKAMSADEVASPLIFHKGRFGQVSMLQAS